MDYQASGLVMIDTKGSLYNVRMRLQNVDFEELDLFYNALTSEKKYFDQNPLEPPGTLEFVTGVRIGNELVGIGGLKRYFYFFHFTFRIVKIQFQGRGLSKQIVNNLITYAKERRYSFLLISVNRDNTASLASWLKMGAKILCYADNVYRMGYYLNWRGKVACKVFVPILFSIYLPAVKLKRLIFDNVAKRVKGPTQVRHTHRR